MPPLVLAIDIGSSSLRTALYDARATLLTATVARAPGGFRIAADGTAEDDPRLLFERVVQCLDATLAAAAALQMPIVAVACATYVTSLLGVDAAGEPITPIYTYADTRAADAADALRAHLDEAQVLQRTGCPLRTSYYPALLHWLRATDPELMRRVARWQSIGAWLYERLLGRWCTSLSAAAWTGLLNRWTCTWDAELLTLLGLDAAQLGPLVDSDASLSGLRAPWAARWPALAQARWFPAIGDGAAANLGSGCIDPRAVALSVGTSGALRVLLPHEPQIPAGLWCYRLDRSHPLLGSATSEGGNVLDWARRVLGLSAEAIDAWLLDPAGARHHLTVLPFIAGERGPDWGGASWATISGITSDTTPLDLARALIEGVTYRWALIAERLRPWLAEAPLVIGSGGALQRLPAWGQVIADALNLPVAISPYPETTMRGAVLLALRNLGLIQRFEDLLAWPEPTYRPDRERHAAHREALARQRQLYQHLQPA